MDKSLRIELDQVDQTTDPADFVRYLDATRATDYFWEIRRRSYELLDLHSGEHVCDVGCGTGDDVLVLARLVGPRGRGLGMDASATMIAGGAAPGRQPVGTPGGSRAAPAAEPGE